MTFVSAGKGTVAHIAGEQFKSVAGLDMVHVPYNNSQLMVDLGAGRTSMIIYPYIALKPFLASGQLVSLATLGNERPAWMRDVPTMAESGYPSLVFTSWFAIFGPANLPSEVVTKVSDAFRRALAEPTIAAGLVADGTDPAYADGAELGRFTVSEITRLRSVVKNANLTFDE
jgi:tripartite-type tricarboxylate transporter receptor subunit TctC